MFKRFQCAHDLMHTGNISGMAETVKNSSPISVFFLGFKHPQPQMAQSIIPIIEKNFLFFAIFVWVAFCLIAFNTTCLIQWCRWVPSTRHGHGNAMLAP